LHDSLLKINYCDLKNTSEQLAAVIGKLIGRTFEIASLKIVISDLAPKTGISIGYARFDWAPIIRRYRKDKF